MPDLTSEQQQHLDRITAMLRDRFQLYVGTNVTPELMSSLRQEVLALLPQPRDAVVEVTTDELRPDAVTVRVRSDDPVTMEFLLDAGGRVVPKEPAAGAVIREDFKKAAGLVGRPGNCLPD